MDLKGRKVVRFRCNIDPMVGVKPQQAFDRRHMKDSEMELTPAGVYVKLKVCVPGSPVRVEEHIVPFANIQSIMLEPVEEK